MGGPHRGAPNGRALTLGPIWALIPIWGRPELTDLCIRWLTTIRAELQPEVDFRIQVVGSEGPATRSRMLNLGVDSYLEHQNSPVGSKLNAGGRAILARNAAGLIILGSDDFFTAAWVRQAAKDMAAGHLCSGMTQYGFGNLETGELRLCRRWTSRHPEQPVGVGRCWSGEALAALGGDLWSRSRDNGLDTDSWLRTHSLREAGGTVSRHPFKNGIAAIGWKGGGAQMWSWERIALSLGRRNLEPENWVLLEPEWMAHNFGQGLDAALRGLREHLAG